VEGTHTRGAWNCSAVDEELFSVFLIPGLPEEKRPESEKGDGTKGGREGRERDREREGECKGGESG